MSEGIITVAISITGGTDTSIMAKVLTVERERNSAVRPKVSQQAIGERFVEGQDANMICQGSKGNEVLVVFSVPRRLCGKNSCR